MGVKIHLHCFEYGRGQQPELNQYCEKVYYYKRNPSLSAFLNRLPFIVSSRKNADLLHNLNQISAPVLLEGIHCTYYLFTNEIKEKNVWVRLHNVEFQYYRHLARSTQNIFKKIFFTIESKLLKKYEAAISRKAKLITVTLKDKATYQDLFHAKDLINIPVFLPFTEITSMEGMGDYCLYHGNLSVPENDKAVRWLIENACKDLNVKLIVAGKNPSASLKNLISRHTKILLIENPGEKEMEALVINAHIHLLPSFNATGIKIKLLHALFNGRFVITNTASVDGTGLESLCTIAETPSTYKEAITRLFNQSFTQEDIFKRKSILKKLYDHEKNAQQLMDLLFK